MVIKGDFKDRIGSSFLRERNGEGEKERFALSAFFFIYFCYDGRCCRCLYVH